MKDEARMITASGTTMTASASSINVTIPNTVSGKPPNYVRIQVTNYAFIKFGASGVAATSNDILMSPNEPEVFAISGSTYIACIQQASGGLVNITPLENVQ